MSSTQKNSGMEHYVDDFERIPKNIKENWFSKQRLSALKTFQESGFPTTRHENWKYTDVRSIARKPFLISTDHDIDINKDDIEAAKYTGLDCIELVYINGVFSKDHSNINDLPDNVVICDLATALKKSSRTDCQSLVAIR